MTDETTGTLEKLENARAQILEILKAEGFKMRVDDFDEVAYITMTKESLKLLCERNGINYETAIRSKAK